MIQWTEPNVFGIDWDPPGQLVAQPAKIIGEQEMRESLFATPECLQWINFHSQYIMPEGNLFGIQYYGYNSLCVAVGKLYTSNRDLVPCEEAPCGKGVKSDRGVVTPLSAYDESKSGFTYVYVYLRIGCTHPNLKVGWAAMHDRRDHCPDCGFGARYDTSG